MNETGRNGYQSVVKKRLEKDFPGCEIRKLDPNEIQGSPDLLILYGPKWATLETKKTKDSKRQPNQPYYVEKHNRESFSRFIYPENEEEVFKDLCEFFKR